MKFAAALVAAHRLLSERRTPGSRILFDAVNDAFVYEAQNEKA